MDPSRIGQAAGEGNTLRHSRERIQSRPIHKQEGCDYVCTRV